jgi:predicted nucleic acid-binding protein
MVAMDRLISNATPLIYLAKANQLEILKTVVQQIIIPQSVYREVVVEGKNLGERDAYRVERAISQGWIIVQEAKDTYPVEIPIHPGEAEVISLAKEIGLKRVLVDDVKARVACQLAGLRPIGTVGIILMAVKDHKLSFDQFLTTLEDIVRSGFFLKEEIYLRAVQEAKRLSSL